MEGRLMQPIHEPEQQNFTEPQSFQSPAHDSPPQFNTRRRKGWIIAGITLGIFLTLTIAGVLTYRYYFHANINPVTLNQKEQAVLDDKLAQIEASERAAALPVDEGTMVELNQSTIIPSPAEQEAMLRQQEIDRRTIVLTQRELNGMLNHNTDLGKYLKIDLKNGYIDIDYVIPVDEEVPVMGGKQIRTSIDVSMAKLDNGRLALAIEDISVGGIPMPNAWLSTVGIEKGANLLDHLGNDEGLLKIFSDGIEAIDISGGEMKVLLAN